MLFAVALVTSQLAGSLRRQALLARLHAARNATIAGLADRLLACRDRQEIAAVVVADLARVFDCQTIFAVPEPEEEPRLVAGMPAVPRLAPSDLAALAITLATGQPAGRGLRRAEAVDWQFRAIASDRGVIAAIGLARADGRPPVVAGQDDLLANLLDQAALALERARLEVAARETAATRERDRMRAVLLASIGDDVKPGLLAILAGARSLRRNPGDKAAATAVAAEAVRLDRYVDNLVDLSPGDDQTPIAAGTLAIDLFRRTVARDGQAVHLTPKEFGVLAELARHAGRVLTHAQLLRAVWGPAHETHVDYLRVAVRALRQKLEDDPARPVLIVNEPAVGYRLMLPSAAA
jgi:K+-sensing histidine kinase KdpD